MPLKFALFENHLTINPKGYVAFVQDLQSKTQDDVIDMMIGRGSTVTRAEALSVIEEFSSVIVQMVKDGYAINTPLFNFNPSIKGIFESTDQSFNPAVHSVKINITPGIRLREVIPQVTVEKVKGISPKPDIEYLDDLGSHTRNLQLTPGNIARIRGSRLKFDETDTAQGIFLITMNGAEIKVTTVANNKPSQLDFLVPELASGEYKLEVRAIISKGKETKKGILTSTLTVAEIQR